MLSFQGFDLIGQQISFLLHFSVGLNEIFNSLFAIRDLGRRARRSVRINQSLVKLGDFYP